ncbi:ELKS/Rab6-interacting/CAST family member 1 isoform X14 [Sus scrofa]|uniref:ELKS/Rab6-interacting/CAST family member 1 isoform X14 n=1 Tax=Sus scrofa TaxID=9823 RepID=UPI000A2B816B|nr:ELKS/Rab6-interacting/CAST family member 1 isoform X14 [Sus scrofa]
MYGSARSVGKVESSNQSPGRSPRLPRSPRLGHRRTNSTGGSSGSSVGGGSGKTLSMENIQSLNAAYATSGPMYLSDHENVGSETPKSTMTLGRSGGRLPYGVRMTAMGSSPNIASSGVASDTIAFGEHHLPPVSMASTVPHSLRQARDNTIMDLQTQLKEVLRENDLLRKDVEVKESKLSSSMNSIKTFWSPELKKERALRKDEASKITIWKEQYRVVQEENQHMQMTIQALQDELRIQRDLNQLFQQDSSSRTGEPCVAELTEENFQRLHAEHERQAKELFLLRKTLEEMELRIETQKQTLNARDESIKKLLEMLQSKGLSAKATEEDHERTRRLAEAEMHVHHLESLLDQKEKENALLREEMHRRFENAPDSAKTKALQTVIEMKDSKISSMERGLRDLEEEIQMLKSNGALSTEEREEEMKQMEVYRSHSKFMKNKVEQLKEELNSKEAQGEELKKRAAGLQAEIGQVKQELSRKDTELLALQTKLETLTNQFSDSKQHIEVLKESLTAKEQRAAILQTEVDALRLRLEEKETMLNKKTKQIQDMAEEKGTQAGEIHDLKDMLDVKERKVNVLQKKIENLQEQLRDKEKQMSSLKERVKSLQADTTNTDTALTTLEEALAEKERTIERLKEQRDRDEREKQEEIDNYKKDLKDLKEKVSLLQGDLSEKEASLLDLKEHASSLASSGLKKDSRLKTLEIALEQKKEECLKMESQLKKAHEATLEARASPEMSDRIQQLEREIARYKDESSKAQAEVDRLLEILKEVENEKNDKDKKIAELERQVKDQNKKVANLKHKEQVEKKKSAQMLEEARRREDDLNDSSQQLQVEELLMAMEKVKQELESMKAKLSSTQQSLAEKETHLTNLRAERRKHLEEVLEMKQEALLAAISEKDANIALLELSSSKKKTQEEVAALKREKDRLVQQLKQQTQNRMKLMADNYEDDHFRSSHSNQTNHKPSPDQNIQPLLELDQNRSKLKLYIGHLTALCHDRDPLILRGLTPPASYNLDDDQAAWENELQKMTQEQLQNELEKGERDNTELQEFANAVLQQIADHCPDILEQVVNALEESS